MQIWERSCRVFRCLPLQRLIGGSRSFGGGSDDDEQVQDINIGLLCSRINLNNWQLCW